MYKVIGIDADVSRSCGTSIPIVQVNSPWCWWHGEKKTQRWFAGNQLNHEVSKHDLHLLREPVLFNPKKAVIALFAATDFLDFNRAVLPQILNQERCQWGCLGSIQPLILVTCTSWIHAHRWLDDLARMTVHSIDRRLQNSSSVNTKKETLRTMADIAIQIAQDPLIKLNLHIRVCARMLENSEINQYFCDHVEGVYPDVETWEFEKMMYVYSQNIKSEEHFFQT